MSRPSTARRLWWRLNPLTPAGWVAIIVIALWAVAIYALVTTP